MSARRWAAGLGGATVLALTAGCGMLGIGGGGEDESVEERLIAMLNESSRIEADLTSAENRIVQNCLEEQGFTVHEPYSFEDYEPYEQESLSEGYPHEDFMIDMDEAKEYGYGAWADSAEAQESGEAEDYWAHQEEQWQEESGEEEEWVEPDSTEWDALEPGVQYDWYVAYQGAEYTEDQNGSRDAYISMMSEEELTEEEYAALEEEEATEEEATDEGEISVEDEDAYVEPKPGGCKLEMIEALYGEPKMVEETYEDEGGGSYTYWEFRPANPAYADGEEESMYEGILAEYTSAMSDVQGKYLDCITERGYADFSFDEYSSLPARMYLYEIYYEGIPEEERMVSYGDDTEDLPPLPEDLSDYEAKKAYEIQMAVDFTECGDEVGYADASEKAYDEANTKAYLAVEEDIYAWQQEMNDSLSKAQEMLDK